MIIVEKIIEVRALLDSGCQFNFISASIARKLYLKAIRSTHNIKCINNASGVSKYFVNLDLKSRYSSFTLRVKCLIIDEIVNLITTRLDTSILKTGIFQNIYH